MCFMKVAYNCGKFSKPADSLATADNCSGKTTEVKSSREPRFARVTQDSIPGLASAKPCLKCFKTSNYGFNEIYMVFFSCNLKMSPTALVLRASHQYAVTLPLHLIITVL